jgi:hypothetical protein
MMGQSSSHYFLTTLQFNPKCTLQSIISVRGSSTDMTFISVGQDFLLCVMVNCNNPIYTQKPIHIIQNIPKEYGVVVRHQHNAQWVSTVTFLFCKLCYSWHWIWWCSVTTKTWHATLREDTAINHHWLMIAGKYQFNCIYRCHYIKLQLRQHVLCLINMIDHTNEVGMAS